MTGGVAFVYDEFGALARRVNTDSVELKKPTPGELTQIRRLIEEHTRATQSPRGIKMLYRFDDIAKHFVKVVPEAYERMQAVIERAEHAGLSHEQALEREFEQAKGKSAGRDAGVSAKGAR